MCKVFTALVAAMLAGWLVAGSAGSASAHSGKRGCNCGPVAPVTHYKLVHPNVYKTRYNNVSVYKHVQKVRRITTVTKVQPIVHLHIVTNVHHHTIVSIRNQYASMTEHIRPISVVTRSAHHFYDCHCGH